MANKPTGRPNGRPPKYTESQIIEALRQSGGILAAACRLLGCARNTLRRYIRESPALQSAVAEINEQTLDLAEGQLLSKISEGHMTAIIFYLKTKGKHRGYVERAVIEHKGMPDPGADLSGLAAERLEAAVNKLIRGTKRGEVPVVAGPNLSGDGQGGQ